MLTYQYERTDNMIDIFEDDISLLNPMSGMEPKLAQMYIPYQMNADGYPPEEALEKGTAFPGLYSPWDKGQNY